MFTINNSNETIRKPCLRFIVNKIKPWYSYWVATLPEATYTNAWYFSQA